jgi:hypothetical protein
MNAAPETFASGRGHRHRGVHGAGPDQLVHQRQRRLHPIQHQCRCDRGRHHPAERCAKPARCPTTDSAAAPAAAARKRRLLLESIVASLPAAGLKCRLLRHDQLKALRDQGPATLLASLCWPSRTVRLRSSHRRRRDSRSSRTCRIGSRSLATETERRGLDVAPLRQGFSVANDPSLASPRARSAQGTLAFYRTSSSSLHRKLAVAATSCRRSA